MTRRSPGRFPGRLVPIWASDVRRRGADRHVGVVLQAFRAAQRPPPDRRAPRAPSTISRRFCTSGRCASRMGTARRSPSLPERHDDEPAEQDVVAAIERLGQHGDAAAVARVGQRQRRPHAQVASASWRRRRAPPRAACRARRRPDGSDPTAAQSASGAIDVGWPPRASAAAVSGCGGSATSSSAASRRCASGRRERHERRQLGRGAEIAQPAALERLGHEPRCGAGSPRRPGPAPARAEVGVQPVVEQAAQGGGALGPLLGQVVALVRIGGQVVIGAEAETHVADQLLAAERRPSACPPARRRRAAGGRPARAASPARGRGRSRASAPAPRCRAG